MAMSLADRPRHRSPETRALPRPSFLLLSLSPFLRPLSTLQALFRTSPSRTQVAAAPHCRRLLLPATSGSLRTPVAQPSGQRSAARLLSPLFPLCLELAVVLSPLPTTPALKQPSSPEREFHRQPTLS